MTASSANLWVGYPGTQSVNFGRNVSGDVEMRLRMDPDVAPLADHVELQFAGFGHAGLGRRDCAGADYGRQRGNQDCGFGAGHFRSSPCR